jgi:hypothetical protein
MQINMKATEQRLSYIDLFSLSAYLGLPRCEVALEKNKSVFFCIYKCHLMFISKCI